MTINYQIEISKLSEVICVILTDGEENSSQNYSLIDIQKMNQTMENEHKWKYIYLGANQDSFQVRNNLGLHPTVGSCTNYTPTADGLNDVMRSLSLNLSRCISSNERVESFNPNISLESQNDEVTLLMPNQLFGDSFLTLEPTLSLSSSYSVI